MRYWQHLVIAIVVLALAQLLPNNALADEEIAAGMRADISLDLPIWPTLADLDPASGGSFDATGFGIGASAHWPLRRFENSDLLIGIDGTIAATDSSVSGPIGDCISAVRSSGNSVMHVTCLWISASAITNSTWHRSTRNGGAQSSTSTSANLPRAALSVVPGMSAPGSPIKRAG